MRLRHHHINFRVVSRIIGLLLMIEAAFMLIPMLTSLCYGEVDCLMSFVWSALVTFACGLGLSNVPIKTTQLRRREGFLLTGVVWIFFSAFSVLPFYMSGVLSNVTDAFFESMSGFTTTGLSLIKDVETAPKGILMWRALSQWIGGMGIILFTLAVIPMLNTKGGIVMFNAEVTGISHERMRPRVSETAMWMWGLYLFYTVLLAFLLILGPMDAFTAVCHTLSTVSTGGFSTVNDYATIADPYSNSMILIFMFVCGVNFALVFAVAKRNGWKAVKNSTTFKWYSLVVLVTSFIIAARMLHHDMALNNSKGQPLFSDVDLVNHALRAVFDTVSAITSTGYAAVDFEHYGTFVSFTIMVVMFFGGMAGSTAGGAKIDRMIVMIKNIRNEFYKVIHPNAVTAVRVDGRAVPQFLVSRVVAFLSIFIFYMVVMALIYNFLGLDNPFDAFFTSMSCISNVGLNIVNDLDAIHPVAKWLMSLEMLVGRLELFTVLVLFTRDFWFED
ncbi:MAG: TrkH family potassium uptake protein [Bacteroidales bacterium]|nr:TrkH family potassium uptake protein [Bacteroidales bacterium]